MWQMSFIEPGPLKHFVVSYIIVWREASLHSGVIMEVPESSIKPVFLIFLHD